MSVKKKPAQAGHVSSTAGQGLEQLQQQLAEIMQQLRAFETHLHLARLQSMTEAATSRGNVSINISGKVGQVVMGNAAVTDQHVGM